MRATGTSITILPTLHATELGWKRDQEERAATCTCSMLMGERTHILGNAPCPAHAVARSTR